MRSIVFAACAGIALSLAAAAMAAEAGGGATAASAPAADGPTPDGPAGNAPITFEAYRNWRLAAMERRLSEIEVALAATDLPAPRKKRLEETRAYYKFLTSLPEAERDKRFRERFDRIDANHDGVIDAAERAAWRERQWAYYGGKKPEATRPAAN